jgi:hypothetical protein
MSCREEFKPIQGMYEGINLNNGRISELIDAIESVFGKENVSFINLSFTVSDNKKDNENEVRDIISLTHRSPKDTKKDRILLDMKRTKSLDKIIDALDKFKEDK